MENTSFYNIYHNIILNWVSLHWQKSQCMIEWRWAWLSTAEQPVKMPLELSSTVVPHDYSHYENLKIAYTRKNENVHLDTQMDTLGNLDTQEALCINACYSVNHSSLAEWQKQTYRSCTSWKNE